MSRKGLLLGLAGIVLAAVAVVLAFQFGGPDREAGGRPARYHCPMHPTVVSDRPGSCPICGMDLVPISEATAPEPEPAEAPRYHCPMHPTVVSDRPGSCPICGMDLVPIPQKEQAPSGGEAVPGLAPVHLTERKRQLIGVRTEPVRRLDFRRTVKAVGRVAVDETRIRRVTTKIGGYVERLHANAVGQAVRQGQPLLDLYSPELLASQNEFLVALAARDRTAGSTLPSVAGYGDELVASARRRLSLFDLTEAQIERLERTGEPQRVVTLYAPISGVILARELAQGQRIEAGMTLLELADLSRLWVLASVYEYELPYVTVGDEAEVTLAYLPGRVFPGKVSFVYPTLDAATRTAQVRVEVPNPGGDLRPDMYADVTLGTSFGERLAVPRSAVLETGERSVAFVETAAGVFEPRELQIGLRLEDAYEVLSGLAEGETVVVSGNFLIDSESQLRAALEGMKAAPAPAEPPPGHAGH